MTGIIQKDGTVKGTDYKIYQLPKRLDKYLIDAKAVGGRGSFARQSIDSYIGMIVEFVPIGNGYNYTIIKT